MCLLRLFLLCWMYSLSLQSKVLMLTTEYFSIETFQLVCELNSYFPMHFWKDRRFFVSSWLVVTESSRLEWDAWREFSSSRSWSSSSCTSPPGHSTSSRPGRPVYRWRDISQDRVCQKAESFRDIGRSHDGIDWQRNQSKSKTETWFINPQE